MPTKHTSALDVAVIVGRRAAERGFDWDVPQDALEKVVEEAQELREAMDGVPGAGDLAEELGDLLFAVCNVARMLQLSPQKALVDATQKFERRFKFVLDAIQRDGLRPEDLPLHILESYWQEAKGADLP